MVKLKEKIHKARQQYALNASIYNQIERLRNYEIRGDKIYFQMDYKDLQQNMMLDLPSKEEIVEYAKKKYKNFDCSMFSKCVYVFNYFGNDFPTIRNLSLIIDAEDSDVLFEFNSVGYLAIKADNVNLEHNNISKCLKTDSNFTKIQYDCNALKGNIDINSKKVILKCIDLSSDKDIKIQASDIVLYESDIEAKNISLSAYKKIKSNKSKITVKDSLIINDENNDVIENVSAKKIIYNDVDITESESVQLPIYRRRLIEDLKLILNNLKENINVEAKEKSKEYKKSLSNQPIEKLIKK